MLSPVNNLEKTLYKASEDHEKTSAFYSELMESKVFILGKSEDGAEFRTGEEQAIIIQHWERSNGQSSVVPFFTSLEMLQSTIEGDESYLELTAVDLFHLTIGAALVLNPNSNLGMEFEPEDIAILLDIDLMENQKTVLDEKTDVILGYAENVSDRFMSVLSAFFSKHEEVEAAYIATIRIPAENDKEHLIVGIQGKGRFEKVIDTAIKKISLLDDDMMYEIVDFYVIEQDDPDISEFILDNISPFYLSKGKTIH